MSSSPPSKSQSPGPLHNFSFLDLKWSNSHHRGRRGESSSSQQSPAPNHAISRPVTDSARRPSTLRVLVGGKPLLQPKNVSAKFERVMENVSDLKELGETPQSSKQLRVRIKSKPIEVPLEEEEREDVGEEMEVDEEDKKTWNLRPRKPQKKKPSTSRSDDKAELPLAAEEDAGSKDLPLKWPKFSLSLTQEEIEEDIFAMTGSKPSRKPKRRPKAVQKQLDNIFPGMWLESLTPDAYKVPEACKKKKK